MGSLRIVILTLHLNIFWSNPDESLQHFIAHVDYTWSAIRENGMLHSVVDHFVGSNKIYEAITEAGVIHSPDNFSDHSPIYCKVRVGELDVSLEANNRKPVPSWSKAKEIKKEAWSFDVTERLNNIPVPTCLHCKNLHCKDHTEDIEDYSMDILQAVEDSSKHCLPQTGSNGKSHQGVSIPRRIQVLVCCLDQ